MSVSFQYTPDIGPVLAECCLMLFNVGLALIRLLSWYRRSSLSWSVADLCWPILSVVTDILSVCRLSDEGIWEFTAPSSLSCPCFSIHCIIVHILQHIYIILLDNPSPHKPQWLKSFSAGTVFRRQNLTSVDVRVWRLTSVPELKE